MVNKENIYKGLAIKIRDGDQTAFEILFKHMHKQLCNYAFVFLRDFDLANEIVQETFIKLWETRDHINTGLSLKAYIYRCVYNNCISYIRKARSEANRLETYFHDLEVTSQLIELAHGDDKVEKLASEELKDEIYLIIESLPEQCREIFLMSRYKYLSYKEIGSILGISVNTVKTQIHRALMKLRKKLNDS